MNSGPGSTEPRQGRLPVLGRSRAPARNAGSPLSPTRALGRAPLRPCPACTGRQRPWSARLFPASPCRRRPCARPGQDAFRRSRSGAWQAGVAQTDRRKGRHRRRWPLRNSQACSCGGDHEGATWSRNEMSAALAPATRLRPAMRWMRAAPCRSSGGSPAPANSWPSRRASPPGSPARRPGIHAARALSGKRAALRFEPRPGRRAAAPVENAKPPAAQAAGPAAAGLWRWQPKPRRPRRRGASFVKLCAPMLP